MEAGTNSASSRVPTRAMKVYKGYAIKVEAVGDKWRCTVAPTRNDLPRLWRVFYRDTANSALADAKQRIDEALTL